MSSVVEHSTCPNCGNEEMNTETNNKPVLYVTHLCDKCGYYMRCLWGVIGETKGEVAFDSQYEKEV